MRTGRRCPTRSKPNEVGDQQLAAPHRAVGPVAEAVERQPEHRFGAAVLDHARRDVGVVVLHGDASAGRARARTWSTGTRGAGRGRPPRASTPYRPQRWSTAWQERPVRRQVLEVADVVAGHDRSRRVATLTVLFSSAPTASTGRRAANGKRNRLRGVAAGPAQDLQPAAASARTTESSQRMWIGRSWVQQPVDQRAEPGDGVVVVVGDRLVAAGCRSSSPAAGRRRAQQQVVQRAVRQHHARARAGPAPPPAATGRVAGRRARARSDGGATSAPLRRGRRARTAGAAASTIGDHHRERLVVARLAPAELGDRGVVGASTTRW